MRVGISLFLTSVHVRTQDTKKALALPRALSINPAMARSSPQDEAPNAESPRGPSKVMSALKLAAASAILLNAATTYQGAHAETAPLAEHTIPDHAEHDDPSRRRLQAQSGGPSYMKALFDELKERKKLMEETPPEEVKYWFEYTGALQVRPPMIDYIVLFVS